MSTGTRTRAFLIGVGSLFDLRGQATYEAMQDLMPSPRLKPLRVVYNETNHSIRTTSPASQR